MATGNRNCRTPGGMRSRALQVLWWGLLLWSGAAAAGQSVAGVERVGADAHAIAVALQDRREWRFTQDGVAFDNRLPDARLNTVERLGRNRYRVTIAPETQPINPSPWYGFAVTATQPRNVRIEFHYTAARHRYHPWLSDDAGRQWRRATEHEFGTDRSGTAWLRVQAGPQPTRIFAQPPVGLDAVDQWTAALAQRVPVQAEVVGHSVQGRPLHVLAFGNPQAERVVLVVGRQHPPEITGMRALMAFVDALADDGAEAAAFRAQHRVVLIPVVNPDGVVEGHWRTNLGGTDLNRDWGVFREPETRALRDALWYAIDGAGRKPVFVLDFHSTWHDVFYTVTEDPARAPGGVLRAWMDAMQARYPDRIREAPSAASSAVFKNWAFRRFGAPSVTYEVGDNTDQATLDGLARFAAAQLMQVLAPPPVPPAGAAP